MYIERKSIGISLQVNSQTIDLQVPIQVSITRLKELMRESLMLLGIQLPVKFTLVIINKPIHLKEEQFLSDYPISDGDQLLIK